MSKEIDMCNGPIVGKLLVFAFPLMCSSVLQLLFNAADTIVVGRFAGPDSLAAVGSTASLIQLITNMFVGLSVGANAVAARYHGHGMKEEVNKTVHTAISMSIICGIILTFASIPLARIFLEMMSSPENVIGLSTTYLRIYFLGMPAMMLYNFGSAMLRALGDTKRPLYILAFSGVINIIMNLFFVIVIRMDVAGVACATIISQYISAILILLVLAKEKGELHLDIKKIRCDKKVLGKIMAIGFPAGLQGTIFSISNVVIQSSVNSFGSVVMAGSAAAASLEGFMYVAMNAFHHTAITFNSQNLGARNYDRIDKITFSCVGLVACIGVVLSVIFVGFGPELLAIYTNDSASIQAGMDRMKMVAAFYTLCGLMDVMPGCLRGMSFSIMPMIVSLLGACAFRLVWVWTIFPYHHTTSNLYLSYPVSWIITFAVHIICYMVARKIIRKREI